MRVMFSATVCAALVAILALSQAALAQQKPAVPKAPAALAKGQFATEAQAKGNCPTDAVVWANLRSKVYHASSSRSYGTTKQGAYMCEKESVAAGFRAPKSPSNSATRTAKPAAT
jgi:hypothetical protein